MMKTVILVRIPICENFVDGYQYGLGKVGFAINFVDEITKALQKVPAEKRLSAAISLEGYKTFVVYEREMTASEKKEKASKLRKELDKSIDYYKGMLLENEEQLSKLNVLEKADQALDEIR